MMTGIKVIKAADIMSSTREIFSETGVLPPSREHLKIKFGVVDEKLRAQFGNNISKITLLNDHENVPLNKLSELLKQINSCLDGKLKENNRVALEQYKTIIMDSIVKDLDALSKKNQEEEPSKNVKSNKILAGIKGFFLGGFALIGLAERLGFTFIGMKSLLQIIFASISNPVLMIASSALTAVELVFFFAFRVKALKKMLGVSNKNNIEKMLEAHDTQLDLTKKINVALRNSDVSSELYKEDYNRLTNLAVQWNEDIQSKKTNYQSISKESPIKKIARFGLMGIGAVMTVAGSYYGAAMLLKAFAFTAPLLGTPVGWILVGALIASSLVFYVSFMNKSVKKLLNPTLDAANTLSDKLDKFDKKERKDKEDFEVSNENIFKKKVERSLSYLDLAESTREKKTIVQKEAASVVRVASHNDGHGIEKGAEEEPAATLSM